MAVIVYQVCVYTKRMNKTTPHTAVQKTITNTAVDGRPSVSDYYNKYIRDTSLDKFPHPAEGFKVRAELKKTPDKGIGVFACEFIPANAIVCDCSSTVYYNEEQTKEVLSCLPTHDARRY